MKTELIDVSVTDLTNLILSLTKLPKINKSGRSEDYEKLKGLLDEASMNKLEKFTHKNAQNQFQICYAWFEVFRQLENECLRCQYPKEFIKHAMDFVVDLSSGELLFVLLISSYYKELPGCKTFRDDAYFLPKFIEDKFVQTWPQWSYIEQTLVCDALYTCRINLKENYKMKNCVKQSIMSVPRDLVIDRNIMSPMIAFLKLLLYENTFTNSYPFESNEIEEFMLKFGPELKYLCFDANIYISKLINQCRTEGKLFENYMYQFVDSLKTKLNDQKDAKSLLDATIILADFNAEKMIDLEVLDLILDAVLNNSDRYKTQYGIYFINILLLMAKMGVVNDHVISDLLRKVNDYKKFKKVIYSDNEDFSTVCLLFLLSLSSQPKVLQTVISKSPRTNKMLRIENIAAIHNLAVLDYLLEIDYPQYSGTRLDPTLRAKIIKFENSMETKLESQKYCRSIHETIENFYTPEMVYFGPTLPHYRNSNDIVLCLNDDLDASKIPCNFQDQLKISECIVRPPKPEPGYIWHCIIIPENKNMTLSGTPTGDIMLKVKHLQKLSFEVSIVGPRQIAWFEKARSGRMTKYGFLSRILNIE